MIEFIARALKKLASTMTSPPQDGVPGLVHDRRDGLPAVTAEDPVLATLLHERQVLAQREDNLLIVTATLTSVGAAVIGALFLTLPELDRWKYFFVPLPLIGLFAILSFISFISNVTTQVLHKVEHELWEKVDHRLAADPLRREEHDIPLPSSSTLSGLLLAPRRARATRTYRAAVNVMVGTVGAALLIPIVSVMAPLGPWLGALALAIYGPPIAVLLAAFFRVNLPHRRALRDATAAAVELGLFPSARPVAPVLPAAETPERRPRSFIGYLLVPRRSELLLKPIATVLGLVLVRAAAYGWSETLDGFLWTAFVVLVAFEYLLYQGRYMLNDVRDATHDDRHSAGRERGRIPNPTPLRVGIVTVIAALRLASWAAVCVRVGGHTGSALLRYGLVVLALAPVYDTFGEWVRRLADDHRRTGRGWGAPWDVPAWPALVRLVLVAPGYALRGLIGASVAFGRPLPFDAALWLGLTLAAAEAANVALGWILEGSTEVAKTQPAYRAGLVRSPHIAWLTWQAGVVQRGYREEPPRPPDDEDDLGGERVLLGRKEVDGPRVWNWAAAISVGCSAPAGIALAARLHDVPSDALLAGAVAGFTGGALFLLRRPRSAALGHLVDFVAVVAGVVVGIAAVVVARRNGLPAPAWAAVPPVLVAALYLGTRVSDYRSYLRISGTVARSALAGAALIVSPVRRLVWVLLVLLLGRDIADRVLG